MPNGFLVSCSKDNFVKIWNTTEWTLVTTYTGHQDEVWALDYLVNNTIATGASDKTIQIWDVLSGKIKKKLAKKQR